MSRAFVNEDAGGDTGPRYALPDPDSPYYDEAAAWALLEGADAGDSRSAELATGYRWGDPKLIEPMRGILAQAQSQEDARVETLAKRFLRAAGAKQP